MSERGDEARDNGYWFYRYLKEQHPEIRCRFVITRDSSDYEKIHVLGGGVPFRSLEHYLLYFSAEYLVSTHVQPCAPDMVAFYHLAGMGICAKGKQVFLQHGIIETDVKWLHSPPCRLDLFACGAKLEYEEVRDRFGHPDGVVQYLGLCRFDHLLQTNVPEKLIVVMPTWRGASYPSGEAFRDTPFFQAFQSLLNSDALETMLEEYGYTLLFYPHVEIQKRGFPFTSGLERVTIADRTTHDVQRLLIDCAALITDYSSVFFDVAHLKKPVLYYQFDEDDFFRMRYGRGYFDYRSMGFGPVCTDEDTLLSALGKLLKCGCALGETEKARIDAFFPLRDRRNCERTFQAILSLGQKGRMTT